MLCVILILFQRGHRKQHVMPVGLMFSTVGGKKHVMRYFDLFEGGIGSNMLYQKF